MLKDSGGQAEAKGSYSFEDQFGMTPPATYLNCISCCMPCAKRNESRRMTAAGHTRPSKQQVATVDGVYADLGADARVHRTYKYGSTPWAATEALATTVPY